MYLCKCNQCDNLLVDHNPQVDAIEFMDDPTIDELIQIIGNEEDIFWACPNCMTDDYLTDILDELV